MAYISPQVARKFISSPRLDPYFRAANGDPDKALELYQWGTELAGAFHATLSFVEISLRNAVDHELRIWNGLHFEPEWTTRGQTREEIRHVAGKGISAARTNAQKELDRKFGRGNRSPSHDQILAQFTFGNLSFLFTDPGGSPSAQREEVRDVIWDSALKNAFPDPQKARSEKICNAQNGRVSLGRSLEHLRRLRNRVAHHDNLLSIDIRAEINVINSVLAKMDAELPGFAMSKSQLRRLRREDPRR